MPNMKPVCSVLLVVSLLAARPIAAEERRLADAAERQDWSAVATLFEQGVDVNAAQPDGSSALHWATHWNDATTVQSLIAAGADVNAVTQTHVTPLILACENGGGAVVEALLLAGANAVTGYPNGETPLMLCAKTGNANAVTQLIAHGADVHAASEDLGQTALMWAAAEGHAPVVRALLAAGASIPAESKLGFTALMFAVRTRTGGLETVKALVEWGADVNQPTPEIRARGAGVGYWMGTDNIDLLPLAIANNNAPVALHLLDQGADPNQSAGGMSALHHAVYGIGQNMETGGGGDDGSGLIGRVELVKALLEHGADPNTQQTAPGLVGFQGDAKHRGWGQAAWGTTRVGATPFYLAADCSNANPELMRILLEYGADPTITTEEGTTPLMAATGLGWGYVPPTEAARRRMFEGVTFLVEEVGADVNAANLAGFTALHGAAYKGSEDIIAYLASNGANLDVRDYRGRTPYRLAQWSRNSTDLWQWPEAAELLIELGANPRLGVDARVQEREVARAVQGQPPAPIGATGQP